MGRMSTIDLVIIGILLGKPRSAYDLNLYIEQGRINRIIKISAPSVYKKCKKLALSGYLIGNLVREGEMPEKSIYKVSDKGRRYFGELMTHYSSQISPFYMEFNTVLIGLDLLEWDEAFEVLTSLTAALEAFANGVKMHEDEIKDNASFAARAIVKQYRMLAETLVKWAHEMVEDYRGERS